MNLLVPNTALVLTIIVSLVIPLISALLSRTHWDQTVTGLITMLLAAVTGFFTEWINSNNATHYDWHTALGLALFSFIVAVATHYGVWKDGNASRRLLAIGSRRAPAPAE